MKRTFSFQMVKTGLMTALLLGAALLAGACSQSTESAVPTANASTDPDQPAVTGAPEESLIKGRGGTKIAVSGHAFPLLAVRQRREPVLSSCGSVGKHVRRHVLQRYATQTRSETRAQAHM